MPNVTRISGWLVSLVRNSLTKSSDAGEDVISAFAPEEWFRVFVVHGQIFANGLFQSQCAAMRTALDLFFSKQSEPALHLINPRGRGGSEVRMEPPMASKPRSHGGGFVCTVVIHDQMHLQSRRYVALHGAEKLQEFLGPVAPMQFTDDLAARYIERSKQGGGAVAQVVVRASLRQARSQRQDRFAAIERLNLTLLIHAQYHRFERWVQIQADDVAHLIDEQWIGGKLKSLLTVRLQSECTPDTAYCGLRQPKLACQRSATPVRGIARALVQGGRNQAFDLCIAQLARCTRPRLIEQTIESMRNKAAAPLAYHLRCHTQAKRHLLVGQGLGTGQDNARAQCQRLGRRSSTRPLD